MLSRDRRLGFRAPLELFINQYIRERPFRGLATNISDTGLFLETVPAAGQRLALDRPTLGLELELPGTGEIIWARGQVCYQHDDGHLMGFGIRFTAMPTVHARLIRDYCVESRRAHLGTLLSRIQVQAAN